MVGPAWEVVGMKASMGETLSALMEKRTVVFPGVFNAFSALLAQAAGFDAVYVSGAGLAGAAGLPDIGLLSREEVARQAQYMIEAVRIPAIIDVDTGFGGILQVMRTVEVFERIGAAGLQIEDQSDPKRCGHLEGKSLVPAAEMARKIRAAAKARTDDRFLLIARTDARGVEGFGAAVARARAYKDEGADLIFPEALQSEREFERFAKEVPGRLLANMTEFGKSPLLTVQRLSEIGYSAVIFPMTLFRVMAKAGEQALVELRRSGTQKTFLDRMQTRQELYRLLRYDEYTNMERELESKEDDGA
jgi:methylisocitrate lyase